MLVEPKSTTLHLFSPLFSFGVQREMHGGRSSSDEATEVLQEVGDVICNSSSDHHLPTSHLERSQGACVSDLGFDSSKPPTVADYTPYLAIAKVQKFHANTNTNQLNTSQKLIATET